MELMNKLFEAAKANKQRIVLPEGEEQRTIIATEEIKNQGLAYPVLIGNQEKIMSMAKSLMLIYLVLKLLIQIAMKRLTNM